MLEPSLPSTAALERLEREVAERVDAGQLASVEADALRPLDGEAGRMGSKPLFHLEDGQGQRFVFKVGEPALMTAEEIAYRLRRLGGRAAVPARRMRIRLPVEGESRELDGLLKPFLEFDVERELETDTTTWSEVTRRVMLREQAWEWFLDNLDTNTSQYAILDPHEYPLNIDWDRSFATAATAELTRFAKYKPQLPNARTFLYADYVEGKIHLDFSVLEREARRIRSMPEPRARELLEEYAAVAFAEPSEAASFVTRALDRKRQISGVVARFVGELRRERRAHQAASARGFVARARVALLVLWDRWQLVLNAVLRGPVGHAGRALLKFLRGRASLPRLSLGGLG